MGDGNGGGKETCEEIWMRERFTAEERCGWYLTVPVISWTSHRGEDVICFDESGVDFADGNCETKHRMFMFYRPKEFGSALILWTVSCTLPVLAAIVVLHRASCMLWEVG